MEISARKTTNDTGAGPFQLDFAIPPERARAASPSHRLALAILESGVRECGDEQQMVAADAQEWAFDSERDDYGSFIGLCQSVGVDPDWLRRRLRAWLRASGRPFWPAQDRAAAAALRVVVRPVRRPPRVTLEPAAAAPLALVAAAGEVAEDCPAAMTARAVRVAALCTLYLRSRNVALAKAIRAETRGLWPASELPLPPPQVPARRVAVDVASDMAQGSSL